MCVLCVQDHLNEVMDSVGYHPCCCNDFVSKCKRRVQNYNIFQKSNFYNDSQNDVKKRLTESRPHTFPDRT